MMSQATTTESYTIIQPRSHLTNDIMLHKQPKLEEDTEEIAGFLLSLKNRSVTPEPIAVSEHGQVITSETPSRVCVDKTPTSMMMMEGQLLVTCLEEREIPVESLLNDCKLVLPKDRDLVPDALFVAMAQMRPCKLTQADRVGCYKSREIGFVGMCCIHCGGQPGFGRYYPNSVRSLAQTTTSQTILKHVGSKCRFCPLHIRQAVNEFQHQQAAREGMSSGRPRYGSRKIFFQRVWSRLHGGPVAEEEDEEASHQTPSDLVSDMESRHSSPITSPATSDDESSLHQVSSTSTNRKFVVLPTQKNLKRSFAITADREAKRPRYVDN